MENTCKTEKIRVQMDCNRHVLFLVLVHLTVASVLFYTLFENRNFNVRNYISSSTSKNRTGYPMKNKKQYLIHPMFTYSPNLRTLPSGKIQNKTLNMLWMNQPIWLPMDKINVHLQNTCYYKNCKMIKHSTNIKDMAALLFSAQDELRPTVLSQYNRPHDQVWIFLRREPPAIYKMNWYHNPIWRKTMNWSWGYRLDSDILISSGTFIQGQTKRDINYSRIYEKKTRDAAWVVSRCSTQSRRTQYVQELQKYGLTVDIFGMCSKMKTKYPWDSIESLINNTYKFYLSFESSFCKDYVTEKFFKYFPLDTVLVVRGSFNYSKYFDKSSFIDTKDFGSIKEVVSYLKEIGNSEKLYTKFLREKDEYKTTSLHDEYARTTCMICEKLNNLNTNRKVYDDIESYIHSNTCYSPDDMH